YELAIMRSIGAGRLQLFLLVLIEGFFLTVAGILLGFGLSHGGFLLLGEFVETINITDLFFVEEELNVFIGALVVGLVSAVIPAMMAYRADISSTLAKG
ncbi:MAG: FtsX-like permease family protein, partial [Cyclobacteriaceae bacterium]